MPETSSRLLIRGSRTAVYAYGSEGGAEIVAIHGFRGTHFGLEPLARALARLGYRVLVPDLPGCGTSSPLEGPHDTSGYGAWLSELADGLESPGLLLGHSFGSVLVGAAIAQGAAHDGSILVNPILRPALRGPRRFATAAARGYYALARRLPEPLGTRLLSSRSVAALGGELMSSARDASLRRWIREEHRRQAGAFSSRDVVLEAYRASTTSALSDFAGRFPHPPLVLGAERDPLSPGVECTAEGSGFLDGTFHVFPGLGHLLPYEAAAELAALIAAWSPSPARVRARTEPASASPS